MATVPNTPRTNRITLASPSAGPFEVGFRLFSATGLEVFVDGLPNTNWTLTYDFGTNGYDDAATITFGSTLPATTVIQIDSAEVPVRQEDYANPDPGLTRKLNAELGRITAALSDLHMKVGRSIRALEEIDPRTGITAEDVANVALYADEAEAARDEILAIQATIPRRRGPWATATAYVFADLVQQNGATYFCLVNHTSGTFNTDLSALRWEVWADRGATGSGSGDVLAANNGSEFNPGVFRTNLGLVIGTNVQAFNQLLAALAGLGSNGIIARLSGSTAAVRTLTGGTFISIINGDGVSGNPTFDIPASALVTSGEGLASSDNDTSLPTTAAVIDFVEAYDDWELVTEQNPISTSDIVVNMDDGYQYQIDARGDSRTDTAGRTISFGGGSNIVIPFGAAASNYAYRVRMEKRANKQKLFVVDVIYGLSPNVNSWVSATRAQHIFGLLSSSPGNPDTGGPTSFTLVGSGHDGTGAVAVYRRKMS